MNEEDDSAGRLITYYGQQHEFDGNLSLSLQISNGHYFLSVLFDPATMKEKTTDNDSENTEEHSVQHFNEERQNDQHVRSFSVPCPLCVCGNADQGPGRCWGCVERAEY